MIPQEKLNNLIDAGEIPYLYCDGRGRIAVTEEILENCGRLSGDVINYGALRALIQIYESELLHLAKKLAVLYPD